MMNINNNFQNTNSIKKNSKVALKDKSKGWNWLSIIVIITGLALLTVGAAGIYMGVGTVKQQSQGNVGKVKPQVKNSALSTSATNASEANTKAEKSATNASEENTKAEKSATNASEENTKADKYIIPTEYVEQVLKTDRFKRTKSWLSNVVTATGSWMYKNIFLVGGTTLAFVGPYVVAKILKYTPSILCGIVIEVLAVLFWIANP